MGKRIFLLILVFSAAGAVFGMDFGLTVDSATDLRQNISEDMTVSHADTATLWGVRRRADSPFGFTWRAWYRYSLDRPVAFELDELYFSAVLEGDAADTSIRAGRFSYSDWGGTVMSHAQDGIRTVVSAGPADIRLAAGSTALIAGHRSTIFLSAEDSDNREKLLGSPRLFVAGGIRLPSLGTVFTPMLEGLTQFEIRPDIDDFVNSQYATLRLNTAIGGGLSIDAVGTGMLLQRREGISRDELGYIGRLALEYIQPQSAGLSLRAQGWYASGDAADSDGATALFGHSLSRYRPVSSQRVTSVFPISIGGSFGGKFTAAARPFGRNAAVWLQETRMSLSATPVFRTSPAAQQTSQTDVNSEELYLGTEAVLGVAMRPTSDIGLDVSGGVYIPGPVLDDSSIRWQSSVTLSLTL